MLCWPRARPSSRRFLMRILRYSLPMLLAVALLAGCGGGGSAAKLDSTDIAVVGPVHVTQKQFGLTLAAAKQSYKSAGKPFPAPGTTDYQTIKGQIVEQLVVDAEREAKAKSMGIVVTPAKVDARLKQIKKQYFGGNEKKYDAQLKKVHLSDDQVREDVRQQLLSEAVYAQLTKNLNIPQKDIDAYYKSHATSYSQP